MQKAKLFDTDYRKGQYTDKLEVRKYVEEKIRGDYLTPLIAVYNNWKEIEWNMLPKAFVIKTNCVSGDTCVVKDKSQMTILQKM